MLAALTAALTAFADETMQLSNKKLSLTESWSYPSSHFNDTYQGTVSWNASTRTLTLDGFGLDRFNYGSTSLLTCLEINSKKDVTINLKNRSWFRVWRGQTFILHGNTTFTGDGRITLVNKDPQKPGIELAEENLTVTIDGPTVWFNGGRGIRGKNNTGTLVLKGGSLEGSDGYKALIGMGNLKFGYGKGVKNSRYVSFSPQKHCMVDKDGNEYKGELVLGSIRYYGFAINGTWITENNWDRIDTWPGISGKVRYDNSTNTLILSDATILNSSTGATIHNEYNNGLVIDVRGVNKFQFYGTRERWAMNLKQNTIIKNVYDYSCCTLTVEDASYAGIYVAPDKFLSLKSTEAHASLVLNIPFMKGGNTHSELYIHSGVEINATGNDKYATMSWLKVNNTLSNPKIAVESTAEAPRFIWNREDGKASGVYANQNSFAMGKVHLSTTSDVSWYSLYICGHQVNSLNKDNPVNEYIKSGSLYSNATNMLTMTNVSIDYDNHEASKAAIQWEGIERDNVLFLRFKGSNTIKNSSNAEAILCKGGLIIDDIDDATLTLTGNNAKVWTADDLTIKSMTATIPEIETKKLIIENSTLHITKKQEADNYELHNVKVASTPEAPAYYDHRTKKIVAPEGTVNFVRSSDVTVYPDIYFCGEQVNSANASCVMSRYLKDGRVEVKKTSDGYQVHLHDVSVYYTGTSQALFEFGNIGGASFHLYGDNNIISSHLPFIGGDAKQLTLRGESSGKEVSLLVNANGRGGSYAGAIIVPANGKLSIYKNAASKLNVSVPCIIGQSTSSTLYVHDPYLTVTGSNYGTVTGIKSELSSNVELYNTSSMPREIRSDGIYSNGDICTEEVKFVKKGESYIPVTGVKVTPTSLTLTKKGETKTLSATVLPADATNKKVNWTTQGDSIVSVDQNGKVRALGNGTTYVYAVPAGALNDSIVGSCKVTVDIPAPTGITLSETDVLIDSKSIGGVYISANLTPSNAETEYTWESSDSTIVSVLRTSGRSALVRRVGDEGTATITVKTANGLSATCNVTVHYPITPELVEFEQRTYTLTEAGQQIKLEPIVTPANCEKLSFIWYTYGEAISLTDDGTVTALRSGSAVVECWACYDGQKWAPGEVRINVEIPPAPVIATGLTISPSSVDAFYSLGESIWLDPVFTPENVTNDSVAWATTDANVATVDKDGIVTVVGWGDCDITATTTDGSNITARRWIQAIDPSTIVEPVPGTAISLDVNEISMLIGGETTISFTITPADYNGDIMVEPISDGEYWNVAQANIDYDWNLNKSFLRIRSEEMGQEGDVQFRVRLTYADMEALNAQGIWTEPSDTITIHVRSGVFSALSPEDISVTYHVSDFNDKACSVYAMSDPMNLSMDPELDDYIVTPAIAPTTIGKLTVPSRADGYWVTSVSNSAFQTCSSLTEIEFSEGITSIGEKVCYSRLFGLERVTLPSTIEELGTYCFAANWRDYTSRSNLREVNIKASTPPTGQNGSSIEYTSAFYNIAEDAVLYVPTGALAAYNVYPWTYWFSRIEEKAFFEDQDAIASPKSSPEGKDFNWFDLSGRRISKPAKSGLYIQNGRKFVIR